MTWWYCSLVQECVSEACNKNAFLIADGVFNEENLFEDFTLYRYVETGTLRYNDIIISYLY